MRIASFLVAGKSAYGLVVEGGVTPVGPADAHSTMREWIGKGLPGASEVASVPPAVPMSAVKFLAPVGDSEHIVAIGLNTKSHFEETAALKNRKAGDYPKYPRLFMRSNRSLVPHGAALVRPADSDSLDYEGEIGLVIGRKARNIDPADWRSYVLGFTCFNDGSVREYQRHSEQVTAGKNFVGSGSWGPSIITLDEVADVRRLELTVDVNGERRQHLRLEDLIFSFGELLAYVTRPFELQPGDVVVTGSPEGIGALRKLYLQPGDELHINLVDGQTGTALLTLHNGVKSA